MSRVVKTLKKRDDTICRPLSGTNTGTPMGGSRFALVLRQFRGTHSGPKHVEWSGLTLARGDL